jgi:ribosomal protein S18 acetylase RimI-like enzyme
MTAHPVPKITRYTADHKSGITRLLIDTGWESRYIDGQLDARVFTAFIQADLVGYASVEFYRWNRLGQLHGLVVDPHMRRRGIARALVDECEAFVRQQGGRGIYVDTPVNNSGARAFYLHQGFKQDYVMTAYYDTDLDGVTYLKLFTI